MKEIADGPWQDSIRLGQLCPNPSPKWCSVKEPENAPGTVHENLEGWVPSLASEDEIRTAFEKAFDYRGDLTITLKSGEQIEGYIFDRKNEGATLADCTVRVLRKNRPKK